ncbi:hypothetical protein SAMN04489760_12052 [Syntrophus gentianae]|uniref:Uncharacterized protein n=1 Tax=Syntrophus gentianae TaxID=43775 RepID=A0A1H7Z8B7_9BACT|nr:hypothetical protein SAMN04489760_12052 [Syntrophus gentianae]
MHDSLIKKIILISSACFLLVILAGAFSYSDKTFLLRSRSVCKIKNLTGVLGKNKIGSVPPTLTAPLNLVAYFPLLSAAIHEITSIFISSQVAYIYPNRGSPFIS